MVIICIISECADNKYTSLNMTEVHFSNQDFRREYGKTVTADTHRLQSYLDYRYQHYVENYEVKRVVE